jgi:predicted PurR-regulated permease PerM
VNLGQWIGFLSLLISLYILWQIRQVLLLVFAAVVLATALNRLARYLQKFHIKRGWAVLISITLLFVILTGFFWLIVPPFAEQFQQLIQLLQLGIEELNNWLDRFRTRVPRDLKQYLPDLDTITGQFPALINQLFERAGNVVSGTLGVMLSSLLVVVLSLMFLVNPAAYRRAFVRLFPSFYRRRVEGILDRCEVALGGWLVGILFNMLVIATFSWLGLTILGVRLSLANGILAGILTFIPNIGPGLSVIPPMAIALLDAPWKTLAVLILYIFIQQAESNFLTPYVMAEQVSLLPAVTLLAQVFFVTFFGFLGLFLALPLTVVAQVWLQEVLIKDILDRWNKPPQFIKGMVDADGESPDRSHPEDSPARSHGEAIGDEAIEG